MVEARGTHCWPRQTALEAQHTPPQGACPVTGHRPVAAGAAAKAAAPAAAAVALASTQPRWPLPGPAHWYPGAHANRPTPGTLHRPALATHCPPTHW